MTPQNKDSNRYIGRFAPSPTGPLHLGSLFTALAGFLDARKNQGLWLLRMDDLDTPRNRPGAEDSILHDLEKFGLVWDETVYYQSQAQDYYHEAMAQLFSQNRVYRCHCSRQFLNGLNLKKPQVYPGLCRNKHSSEPQPHALRIKTDHTVFSFRDRLQGFINQNLADHTGDFIIRRKDRIFAYQFAVVIDDYQQHVTHIVRGHDLLDSTFRQLHLQDQLEYSRPEYMHVPVIVDHQGLKLSKQTHARAVNAEKPTETLFLLLSLLKQGPPESLRKASVSEILAWAIEHWTPQKMARVKKINQ